MTRGTQLFVAAAFAISVAACGGADNREAADGTPGAAGTSGRDASALDMGERNFVQDQIKDGAREIQLGELAEKSGASADVKEFGRTMVQDHTRAGNKLKQIAERQNVELENESDNDEYERLSKLSGREFDKEYIDLMVKDHQDAVDALQDQAQNADHPDVKTWAAETLPRVKHHLEVAQQLQQQFQDDGNAAGQKTNRPGKPRG